MLNTHVYMEISIDIIWVTLAMLLYVYVYIGIKFAILGVFRSYNTWESK